MDRYFKARIAENRPLQKEYNLLTLVPLSAVNEPAPGQFYMIGMEGDYDPLLKRPFSLLRRTSFGLQFLFRVRGRGTLFLRSMKEDSVIDVLGPLGNTYPPPPKGRTPVLVAGGIGMASLFSLGERLTGDAYIFYGVRTGEEFLLLEELERIAKRLTITTDDGSCGEKGCITDIVRNFVSDGAASGALYSIYACGPKPMLGALFSIVKGKGIETFVSMEENMACGIGACLGCVVKTVNGHKRVCKEGPVFPIDEILWT
ncbi:MAG TPA: dihydroorotate dehydrogenase electron transfer subunit [Thermodesulfovibrionales bacterium]|nr:dihydroorotate dehydrogenase electron transfer subunit [Thermodesulfovibrionales bacterium]